MEHSRKREIRKPSRGAAAKHAPRDSLEPHSAVREAAHEPSATSATACGLRIMVMMGRAQQSPATLMERSRKCEILKTLRGAAAKNAPRDSLEPHLAACEAAYEPSARSATVCGLRQTVTWGRAQ